MLKGIANGTLLILLSSPCAGAQEPIARPTPITPLPCPDQQWTVDDPAFAALPGAKAYFGRYAGGTFRIEIPDSWNGELLLWAHGTRSNVGPDGSRLRTPEWPGGARTNSLEWREHLVRNGFAWAASSFRCNGVVAAVGLLDTLSLLDVFSDVSSGQKPSRVYLGGNSQGGLGTWLGLRYFPGVFAGGLALCPPVGADFFTSVHAAAEFIGGVSLDSSNPQELLSKSVATFGAPPNYTDKGRQLASVQIHLSGGPRPFAVEGLASRFHQNIVGLPSEWHTRASSNVGVSYTLDETLGLAAATLNAGVRRKSADASLAGPEGEYAELKGFDGRIEQPLLTLHGTGDLQVPILVEQHMRRAVNDQRRDHLLVQRIMRIPGHCGFSDAEQIRAFEDLVTWVRTGARPEGDDVLQDMRDAGLKFTNPRRPGDPGTTDITAR